MISFGSYNIGQTRKGFGEVSHSPRDMTITNEKAPGLGAGAPVDKITSPLDCRMTRGLSS
jgi:hypothetical protein